MWWYNTLGDKEVSISYLLWFATITEGSFLLTSNIVFMKRENPEPILTIKIIEWRKFIDYFGLSIEADPFRVVKENLFFPYQVYTKPFIYKAPYIKAQSGHRF